MQILLIGNASLQNDAIKKLLLSQDGWKVLQIPPTKIAEEEPDFENNQFSFIDLSSFSYNFESIVKDIRNSGLAANVIVLSDNHSNQLLQKLKGAEADTCLLVNNKTEQFVGAISKFCNS